MPKHPLAEVFGFPATDMSPSANRHRTKRLCPFNNKVPNCTKDKAQDPLGVCSVFHDNEVVITCPIRFRQSWLIADDAADFFFKPDAIDWREMFGDRLPRIALVFGNPQGACRAAEGQQIGRAHV